MLPNELLRYERKVRHNMTQQELAKKLVAKPDPEFARMPLLKGQKDELKDIVRKIKRWEQGLTPIPHYQRELARVFEKDVRELGLPPEGTYPQIPFWHVPYSQPSQNKFFMSREDYLLGLHSVVVLRNQQYKSDERTSNAKAEHLTLQPQALVGLGGIGKTQVALEYAYRYAHEYQTVIWLRAHDTEVLASDFANIATIVNLPKKDIADQTKLIEIVKEWLTHLTRWLLVFDDAEDVGVIRDFLPQKCFGHVIVTTRSPVTGKLAQAIGVEKIPLGEATSFLLNRSKAIGLEMVGTEAIEEKYAQAREIAKLFDGLPLMLEQAGAYIETRGCGLAGYLADYEAQGALVRQKPKLPEKEYPHTVATAWLMSFKNVRQTSPVAANLLSLFAFLAPDAIPEELVTEAASELGPVLNSLTGSPSALNDAMAQLRKYSLVQRHEETKTCSIHNLVQVVIRDGMDEETKKLWVERASRSINHFFLGFIPEDTSVFPLEGFLKEKHRYWAHALVCKLHAEQLGIESPEIRELALKITSYFATLKLKLEWWNRILEITKPAQASAENIFNGFFKAVEWFDELEKVEEKLGDHDKAQDCKDVAQGFLILGIASLALDKNARVAINAPHQWDKLAEIENTYTEIERRYTQTELHPSQTTRFLPKFFSIAFDPRTPFVEEQRNQLLSLVKDQTHCFEVIAFWQRALAAREKTYGPEHPQVAFSLTQLGKLHLSLAKLQRKEAESFRQRAPAIFLKENRRKKVSWKRRNLLAMITAEKRKNENASKAETFLQRALEIHLKAYGLMHLRVAENFNLFAQLYDLQGRDTQAEYYYKLAAGLHVKTLGVDHPQVSNWVHDLGKFYYTRGRYADAHSYYILSANPYLKLLNSFDVETLKLSGQIVMDIIKQRRPKK